jgi:hypothetical protein
MEDDDEKKSTCHVGARQAAFCIQEDYCKGRGGVVMAAARPSQAGQTHDRVCCMHTA